MSVSSTPFHPSKKNHPASIELCSSSSVVTPHVALPTMEETSSYFGPSYRAPTHFTGFSTGSGGKRVAILKLTELVIQVILSLFNSIVVFFLAVLILLTTTQPKLTWLPSTMRPSIRFVSRDLYQFSYMSSHDSFSPIIFVSFIHLFTHLQTLCVVCGCAGTKNCSGCRSRNFCSKEHQKVDWTLGGHKGEKKNSRRDFSFV